MILNMLDLVKSTCRDGSIADRCSVYSSSVLHPILEAMTRVSIVGSSPAVPVLAFAARELESVLKFVPSAVMARNVRKRSGISR
ncbi:hypothetical protein [Neorhizobium sp. NCHU2750]|uniref:hypothetical protein n=1 Tax=Neorhizobium sp. NCHU2750 TaxID=1825976 RepID=UPI000E707F38|nr:hypothetical protein NCHU2750_05740 [Neorhizobium sp. NCHU2750]